MRLILSCLFFSLISFSLLGQVPNSSADIDSTEQRVVEPERPKVPKSFFIPTGIRIGTDLVALGVNAFGDNRQRYEVQADIDFHRIYLIGSYGINKYQTKGEGFEYSNDGNYYRVGIEADFLKFDPDHNTLTFGLRYARANYSELLTTNLVSPIYGPYQESLTNEAVSARWFEMTAGLRVMILKNLYMGYSFRIQLNRRIFNANEFRSYDIPGFGRAEFDNRWTFNYYLTYRLAWKEKKVMERSR
ncbi:hypothetical protein SAMN05661096_02846 [Marivirga sericea]|uniref:Outer membrane protein beta-barrel domain-containing protein n=1 Tax=Marivirga sericea TaxID=1028 RepID=A0A1X7KLQ8_9BACT|nr:DUF6048 family protein [Marivirga sericea]SMG41970.1 hypothetical protein SAMN05661096_02846 [Marivirga sericea]